MNDSLILGDGLGELGCCLGEGSRPDLGLGQVADHLNLIGLVKSPTSHIHSIAVDIVRDSPHFATATMGSAFIPSTFTKATSSSSEPLPTSPQASASCEACRISGTVTFAAVGAYALTFARSQAKTRVGKSAASFAGLGKLLSIRPRARSAGRGTAD